MPFKEEGAVRLERTNKAAEAKIKGNHIPCFGITINPIPQTTICPFHPGGCLSHVCFPWVEIGAINGEGVAELF
ncbi:hypothetical protein E1A91_D01G054300v1 [Gossypium mustelinum]|uniref:Uncharacterized protein n=1 Tax=Gossypium mustelinum TaxID=34275 RepID=A0A5D2W3V1_GOSMU|nr:hypothetical protein E1A91_D01G054300v1 [Gossypium mustelinum]